MGIVLEGADNSGKTTLAKDLIQLNPRLEHFSTGDAPRSKELEELCLKQQHNLLAHPEMIVDRTTCISQQVYQDDRLFDDHLMDRVDLLLQIGTIIVYCRPSTDKLMSFEKFTWRDEETEEHKKKIISKQHIFIERYEKVMTVVPHILYDYEDEMSSAWLRKMLAEAPFEAMTFHRLRDVMLKRIIA